MALTKKVFPAPAGINRHSLRMDWLAKSVPRASGDKPRFDMLGVRAVKCSPRQRG